MSFKKGDRVRVLTTSGMLTAGDEYVVREVLSSGRIKLEGAMGSWMPSRFSLVEGQSVAVAPVSHSRLKALAIVELINSRPRSPSVEEIVCILDGETKK